jgi:hypothetical protein
VAPAAEPLVSVAGLSQSALMPIAPPTLAATMTMVEKIHGRFLLCGFASFKSLEFGKS